MRALCLAIALLFTACSSDPEELGDAGAVLSDAGAVASDAGADAGRVTIIGDQCCCEHIVDVDIVVEDLQAISECPSLPQGECILVDPLRLTPHPCCPQATGDRCGS